MLFTWLIGLQNNELGTTENYVGNILPLEYPYIPFIMMAKNCTAISANNIYIFENFKILFQKGKEVQDQKAIKCIFLIFSEGEWKERKGKDFSVRWLDGLVFFFG